MSIKLNKKIENMI